MAMAAGTERMENIQQAIPMLASSTEGAEIASEEHQGKGRLVEADGLHQISGLPPSSKRTYF